MDARMTRRGMLGTAAALWDELAEPSTTEALGARLADRFAAVAPVAGAHYATGHPDCTPARPVPRTRCAGSTSACSGWSRSPSRR